SRERPPWAPPSTWDPPIARRRNLGGHALRDPGVPLFVCDPLQRGTRLRTGMQGRGPHLGGPSMEGGGRPHAPRHVATTQQRRGVMKRLLAMAVVVSLAFLAFQVPAGAQGSKRFFDGTTAQGLENFF